MKTSKKKPLRRKHEPICDEGAMNMLVGIANQAIKDWYDAHYKIFKANKKREKELETATSEGERGLINFMCDEIIRQQQICIADTEWFLGSKYLRSMNAVLAVKKKEWETRPPHHRTNMPFRKKEQTDAESDSD